MSAAWLVVTDLSDLREFDGLIRCSVLTQPVTTVGAIHRNSPAWSWSIGLEPLAPRKTAAHGSFRRVVAGLGIRILESEADGLTDLRPQHVDLHKRQVEPRRRQVSGMIKPQRACTHASVDTPLGRALSTAPVAVEHTAPSSTTAVPTRVSGPTESTGRESALYYRLGWRSSAIWTNGERGPPEQKLPGANHRD